MKILNLYAGIGGNRKLWKDCEVTAVELDPVIGKVYADQHPDDKLIIGDAHQYLLDHYKEFDFIWSSPPCPTHSRMMKATRHDVVDYFDAKLPQEIVLLQHFFKGRWIVENVISYYEPLIKPTCRMGRHYIWSNFDIMPFNKQSPGNFIKSSTSEDTDKLKDWLGIHYEGNIYSKGNHCPGQVLRNCVHPDMGLHIFNESKRIGLFNINEI